MVKFIGELIGRLIGMSIMRSIDGWWDLLGLIVGIVLLVIALALIVAVIVLIASVCMLGWLCLKDACEALIARLKSKMGPRTLNALMKLKGNSGTSDGSKKKATQTAMMRGVIFIGLLVIIVVCFCV